MSNRLCLGTVQFGLKYGINNELGRQPTCDESFAVLKEAIENGIDYFDTASVYGNAEEVLGKLEIGKYGVKVISKLKAHVEANQIECELRNSLQRLRVDFLNGYLLHDARDFYRMDIMMALLDCREKGLVKNIGVSIYELEDALNVVKSKMVDYIQVPYNVFDQRLNKTDFFETAKCNNVTVFARSVFLQGLLLMNAKKVPSYLMKAKYYLMEFEEIIKKYGYTKMEAAFLFAYCHEGIDRLVFGVETKKQLQENINILYKASDFKNCYKDLYQRFIDIEKEVILPSVWGRQAGDK